MDAGPIFLFRQDLVEFYVTEVWSPYLAMTIAQLR